MPKAPAFPHFTDKYEPTNAKLWEDILELARGERRELRILDHIIHAPNRGLGFKHWPNKGGTGWCIRQYNNLGGKWKTREASAFSLRAIRVMQASGVVESGTPEEHETMAQLQEQGLASQVHATEGTKLWEAGRRLILAGLADELEERMRKLIADATNPKAYAETAAWFDRNFRVDTVKTPKGLKPVKEEARRLLRTLRDFSTPGAVISPGMGNTLQDWWDRLKPHLDDLVRYFTAEGDATTGKTVLTELKLSNATYLNRSNLSNTSFEKYAKSVDQVFAGIKGWRHKALSGNLKVAFVGAQEMRSQGRYKQSEDTLLVKATPTILKRGGGYASLEYILVHELGHRYEKFHGTSGTDFDQPKWWTTRYSRTEGLAGSESFAELFALGHFHLTGDWAPDILDRFEAAMTGGKE